MTSSLSCHVFLSWVQPLQLSFSSVIHFNRSVLCLTNKSYKSKIHFLSYLHIPREEATSLITEVLCGKDDISQPWPMAASEMYSALKYFI